jgi:hypothetical protein
VEPPNKKQKQPAKKKPEPMKLPWERTEEETKTIVTKEVANFFAKVREKSQQEMQDAKK